MPCQSAKKQQTFNFSFISAQPAQSDRLESALHYNVSAAKHKEQFIREADKTYSPLR
jgi:hypothetical protein